MLVSDLGLFFGSINPFYSFFVNVKRLISFPLHLDECFIRTDLASLSLVNINIKRLPCSSDLSLKMYLIYQFSMALRAPDNDLKLGGFLKVLHIKEV